MKTGRKALGLLPSYLNTPGAEDSKARTVRFCKRADLGDGTIQQAADRAPSFAWVWLLLSHRISRLEQEDQDRRKAPPGSGALSDDLQAGEEQAQ